MSYGLCMKTRLVQVSLVRMGMCGSGLMIWLVLLLMWRCIVVLLIAGVVL